MQVSININALTQKYISQINSPEGLSRLQGIMDNAFKEFKGLADKVKIEKERVLSGASKHKTKLVLKYTEEIVDIQSGIQRILKEAEDIFDKQYDPTAYQFLRDEWSRRFFEDILGREQNKVIRRIGVGTKREKEIVANGKIIRYKQTPAEKKAAEGLEETLNNPEKPKISMKLLIPQIEEMLRLDPSEPLNYFNQTFLLYFRHEKSEQELKDAVKQSVDKVENLYKKALILEKQITGQPGAYREYERIKRYMFELSESANKMIGGLRQNGVPGSISSLSITTTLEIISKAYSPIDRSTVDQR